METEARTVNQAESAGKGPKAVLPAARAEHIVSLAKAIGEGAPAAEALLGLKAACEQARTELHEAVEEGREGAREAVRAIDTALISLSRGTMEKQTAHPREYESLSAALRAQAERQAALEVLETAVPLINEEFRQDEVLTEAMAYCKLGESEELVYSVNGEKASLPVNKTARAAAEKARAAFVDIYNHQPARQRFREELEDACKAEAEKEKIENAAFRAARGAYRHELKAYLNGNPEDKQKRAAVLKQGVFFLLPALALLVIALIFGLFKKDGRVVFAFILLLAAGAVGGYVWVKKRLGRLYKAAEAKCTPLKLASDRLKEAKQRAKAQSAAVRETIRHYAEFRKSYLK